MKRKREPEAYRSVWQSVVPVAVFLDDLEDIWNLLAQVGSVTAETDEFEGLATFDELASLGGSRQREVRCVARTTDGEEVLVYLGPSEATVTLTAPRLDFVGVRAQLTGVLLRHWRGWSIADLGPTVLLSAILGVVFLGAASTAFRAPSVFNLVEALALGGAVVVLIGYARHLRRTEWSVIPMVRYADRPRNLLVRRREELILELGFLLAGTVLGYLLARWNPLGP